MELTKEILDAAYNGFVAPNVTNESQYGLDWGQLKSDDIKKLVESLFDLGINPMFTELGLSGCTPNITVKMLDKVNLAYASYISDYNTGCKDKSIYDPNNVKEKAIEMYNDANKNGKDDCCAITQNIVDIYGSLYAKAIADCNLIIINKSIVTRPFGLHLICHEIMHLLANQKTVAKMRGENPNLQDEAVNEYFARLAMYFYINNTANGQENRRKIAGLTSFRSELFVNHLQHDQKLGLYGKLMHDDDYMINKKWDKMTDDQCVDYIKQLARFYFKGGTDPLELVQK